MKPVQLDIFTFQLAATEDSLPRDAAGNPLNGFYYEKSSGLFVTYCMGRRHWEGPPPPFEKAWKEWIMKERAI